VLWLAACASGPPESVVHVVRPGETVYRIAHHYGVSERDVIRANAIRDVRQVPVGAQLRIPHARSEPPDDVLGPAPGAARRPPGDREVARREANLSFAWPVDRPVSSGYGWRRGRRHEGIDIPARSGTPIRAAEAGRVIHSGSELGSYGNVVIVKHAGSYATIYAHNRKNLVARGEFVEKGQVIAQVGASGNADGSHLHFEIRRDRRAEDPVPYLP
jgi:murein DD-endopeptidase MepM/ murein hydrolase activator NlpD